MRISITKQQQTRGEWYLVDANHQVLGRLATGIARILMGKHRPNYTPHVDWGDHVVVTNAAGIQVTGEKHQTKTYYRHSTRPGHLKSRTYADLVSHLPTRPLQLAVKRMLPKNRLQARRLRRLHIYTGPDHPHTAQNPKRLVPNG